MNRIYWLGDFESKGKLGIMARPRGNDWLIDEILAMKRQKVNIVVSLLEDIELEELGLTQEFNLARNHKIDFIEFPIKDVSVPNNPVEFKGLANELYLELKNGENIVIHCRMGIGRSSLLAAAVLLEFGMKKDEVFDQIGKYRGMNVPDTQEQKTWLLSLYK